MIIWASVITRWLVFKEIITYAVGFFDLEKILKIAYRDSFGTCFFGFSFVRVFKEVMQRGLQGYICVLLKYLVKVGICVNNLIWAGLGQKGIISLLHHIKIVLQCSHTLSYNYQHAGVPFALWMIMSWISIVALFHLSMWCHKGKIWLQYLLCAFGKWLDIFINWKEMFFYFQCLSCQTLLANFDVQYRICYSCIFGCL